VEYTRECPTASSSLTKACGLVVLLGVLWKADAPVVGKLVDVVVPATTTLNAVSAATPALVSTPLPPRKVENKIAEPAEFSLVTKTSATPPKKV
jgi:hypothetical protein